MTNEINYHLPHMAKSHIKNYLNLRLLIGFSGEKAEWWSTNFFTESYESFLQPVFPKATRLARYHGVIEAARRVHDDLVGVGNAYHLFRLPENIEQDLHQTLVQKQADKDFFGGFNSQESAFKLLQEFSDGEGIANEGPILIGKTNTISTEKSVQLLSQLYLSAFQKGIISFPYFTD
ncbi:MAG: BrxE family protein [Aridibacter sp.]